MLRQCRVLRESPRVSRKCPNCQSNSLTDRLFCSVLLPLFTVVRMNRCEEDVIIVFGPCLLSEEEKRRKRKYWIHNVFRVRQEDFTLLFGRLKDDWQKFFKYFRMNFSKFENLNQVSHTDIEKKNTRWRLL